MSCYGVISPKEIILFKVDLALDKSQRDIKGSQAQVLLFYETKNCPNLLINCYTMI